ncbi:MAG: AbrB/MazE/SpoVT family DNA-binding domain-containing protein, partial [Desulfurococcales archaeon]|nr:AbrB/MazE/SpoVT family DNA-binding domain-containing protein [Desulfurococcales archaeon]
MTVRRVQVTGGGTYIISIPKEWVKMAGLSKGAEVSVEICLLYTS